MATITQEELHGDFKKQFEKVQNLTEESKQYIIGMISGMEAAERIRKEKEER